jgi:hypothetical protein
MRFLDLIEILIKHFYNIKEFKSLLVKYLIISKDGLIFNILELQLKLYNKWVI